MAKEVSPPFSTNLFILKHLQMGKSRLLLTAIFVSLCYCMAWPQQRVITIDELFRLVDNHSKNIRASEAAVKQAGEAVQVAKANRLPSVDASLSFSYLGDGRIWDRDFSNGMKAPIPHFGNNFAVEASQVIYAGGAIRAGIESAGLQHRVAQLALEENKQNIRFLALGSYLELYKLNNQRTVYQKNIEQTELLLEQIRVRAREGVVLHNDITRHELQLQELQLGLTEVENNMKTMNYQLVATLDLPRSTVIVPDSTLPGQTLEPLSLPRWQQEAMASRPRLKIANAAIALGKQQERITRAERLPTVALVSANHLNGPVTIEVPPLDKNFNYWYVGVGVRYSIDALWKSNSKSRLSKQATLKAEQDFLLAQEETDIAVNTAYIQLQQACEQARTREKSVELATRNYDVVNNRYLNDLALVTDMIDAGNSLLAAELMLVNARVNVIYNHYKLQRVSGTL